MREYIQREYIVYLACSKCSINNNSTSNSNCCHCCYDNDDDDDNDDDYNDKTPQAKDNHSHLGASGSLEEKAKHYAFVLSGQAHFRM